MNDLLSSFNFEIGANYLIPYINITFGNQTYNIFYFLENRDTLHLIKWCVNLSGNVMIFNTIFDVITGIGDILRGRFKMGNNTTCEIYEKVGE